MKNKKVSVGDLVEWYSVQNDAQREFDIDLGIVLSLSRSGRDTLMANVLFEDGNIEWVCTDFLSVISTENHSN